MRQWRPLLACGLLFPLVDFALGTHLVGDVNMVLIYVMLAVGLNLIVGYAGLLHLGYCAFAAVGAFTMAHLTSPQSPLGWELPFAPALVISTLLAAGLGTLLAWPTLRLRGDYLAIVTMGFGLILDPVLRNFDATTKVVTGMTGVAGPGLGTDQPLAWYCFLLSFVGLIIGLAARIRNSRLGRSLRALREDPIAAESCGIDPSRAKLWVNFFGTGIAGLAGALYASYLYTLSMAFPLDFNGSVMVLAMVILGGSGSLRGSVVGALALGLINTVLTPALVGLANRHLVPWLEASHLGYLRPLLDISKAQFLIFGSTLVLMMILRPQGMVPERAQEYQDAV